jgi:hypothetical protein
MEATVSPEKRTLECVEEARSPQRILVRSLLKSRNALRAKYRQLRAECKRWRNQAAAVEKSRDSWRRRALTAEAAFRDPPGGRAAIEAQMPGPSAESAAELASPIARPADSQEGEKRGR